MELNNAQIMKLSHAVTLLREVSDKIDKASGSPKFDAVNHGRINKGCWAAERVVMRLLGTGS